jgi:hypothetical protein
MKNPVNEGWLDKVVDLLLQEGEGIAEGCDLVVDEGTICFRDVSFGYTRKNPS